MTKFSDDFWKEWETNADYIEGDNVDFAFLFDDDKYNLNIPKKYSPIKPSKFFKQKIITEFMQKYLEYNDLSFMYNGKEEKIIKERVYGYEGPKKFFLNIPYPADDNSKPKQTSDKYTIGDFFKEEKDEWDENIKRNIN